MATRDISGDNMLESDVSISNSEAIFTDEVKVGSNNS